MASNSKRKSNVLNIETKLEIQNRLAKGESGASLVEFHNVGKSTISDIKKSRETILNFASKHDSEDGSKKRKTMREANDVVPDCALETAMEWYEQLSECCPIQLLLLKRIRDLAAKKRSTMVQRKIRDYFP
ncbi:jerky-like protein [Trichonephila clavipes]|nr:jerky-like protein [Trichonephila clavipes]